MIINRIPTVDEIAEALWESEYGRATGKRRNVPWSEQSQKTQSQYRYQADAVLNLFSSRD